MTTFSQKYTLLDTNDIPVSNRYIKLHFRTTVMTVLTSEKGTFTMINGSKPNKIEVFEKDENINNTIKGKGKFYSYKIVNNDILLLKEI